MLAHTTQTKLYTEMVTAFAIWHHAAANFTLQIYMYNLWCVSCVLWILFCFLFRSVWCHMASGILPDGIVHFWRDTLPQGICERVTVEYVPWYCHSGGSIMTGDYNPLITTDLYWFLVSIYAFVSSYCSILRWPCDKDIVMCVLSYVIALCLGYSSGTKLQTCGT